MGKLSDINSLVSKDLQEVDNLFRETARSGVPLLNIIMRYMLSRKGKQMRPLFVLLTAGMHGEITPSAHRAAVMIELLHTATLIHDDVVDDAWQRRGLLSLNAIWKNRIAVLVGDYLLSRGLILSLEHKEYNQLHIVANATREMSEGELMQAEKARKLDITEDVYFEIIRKKTASLIASCCAVGASATGATDDVVQKMHSFGEKVGIAFQIKDDLLDYTGGNNTGKPKGLDLKEKKLTLPVIYTLSQMSSQERISAILTIKRFSKRKEKAAWLIGRIESFGGLEYSREKMNQYKREAEEVLDSFPQNEFSSGLKKLVSYSIDRNR